MLLQKKPSINLSYLRLALYPNQRLALLSAKKPQSKRSATLLFLVPHSQPQLPHIRKEPRSSSTLVWTLGMSGVTHPGHQPCLLLQQLSQPGGLLGQGVCVDPGQLFSEAQLLHLGVPGGCSDREEGRHLG
jgi:hypothetical protein